MNAANKSGTGYLPSALVTTAFADLKMDMSKYKVVTYCGNSTEPVLFVETTNGKKYYSRSGEKMVNNDALNSFSPCGTIGVSGPQTTYLNLPTACSGENTTCTFSGGPATVVYGSAAQGRFNYLSNQSSPITCSNATFGDPASGFQKACYVYPN